MGFIKKKDFIYIFNYDWSKEVKLSNVLVILNKVIYSGFKDILKRILFSMSKLYTSRAGTAGLLSCWCPATYTDVSWCHAIYPKLKTSNCIKHRHSCSIHNKVYFNTFFSFLYTLIYTFLTIEILFLRRKKKSKKKWLFLVRTTLKDWRTCLVTGLLCVS